MDYDVVIVGSGPAGLTAGLHLGRAGRRVLVLEKDLYGGNLQHTGQIDDYPEFPNGITGAQLAAQMIDQATSSGVALEQGEVSGLELFSRSRWVACSDGRGFSCGVVILACGTRYTKLGLANEEKFRGRGVVDCTPCDGGFFVNRDVVVYGATDYALRDAAYLSELGVRVTLLSPESTRLDAILGSDRVEEVQYTLLSDGTSQRIRVNGVLIRVGMEPSSESLGDVVDLDTTGYIITNAQLETSAPYVLACGDIRGGSRGSISAAVEDGANAAARAHEVLNR